MLAFKRNLVALSLGAALASPVALAQGNRAIPATPATPAASTVPAAPSLPSQVDTHASDAISARTTARETGLTKSQPAPYNMSDEAQTPPGKGNWWKDADSNGDGKISTTEAIANAGLSSRFSTIDSDKDGFVTMEEYRTFYTSTASQGASHAATHSAVVSRDLWVKLDADADSKLSLAEAASNAGLSASFASMDSNNDGFVTQAEYTAYSKTRP